MFTHFPKIHSFDGKLKINDCFWYKFMYYKKLPLAGG